MENKIHWSIAKEIFKISLQTREQWLIEVTYNFGYFAPKNSRNRQITGFMIWAQIFTAAKRDVNKTFENLQI